MKLRSTKFLKGAKLQATFNPIAGSTYKKDMRLIGAGGKVFLFGGSERTGKKWGIFSSLNFVRKMGLMIPIGLVMSSKSVMGVNVLRIADQDPQVVKRCLDGLVELLNNGKIDPQVGGKFSIDDLGEAHDLLESRKSTGKIIVSW
jgi:NADPH:quinone reductase-like Zn-dependent oxidoreductase